MYKHNGTVLYHKEYNNITIIPTSLTYLYTRIMRFASSANLKIDVAKPMPSSEIMFLKTALDEYVHIYACEKRYTKNAIFERSSCIASSFSRMAFNAFCMCVWVIHFAL